MGNIITFASAKGGTGKSILAVNIAAALAKNGKKVLLADLCAGMRTLDMLCDMENTPAYNFYDLAKGECEKVDAIIQHDKYNNLELIFAPQTVTLEYIEKDLIKDLFNGLSWDYDYIITDTPPCIGENFEKVCGFADKTIVVTEADTVSARTCERTSLFAEKCKIEENLIIINKISIDLIEKRDMIDIDTVVNTVGGTLIGIVPYEKSVLGIYNKGELVIDSDTNFAKACDNIARRIDGEKVPVITERKAGLLNKLFNR